ncbi:hypothetical protein NQ314_019116 [Rhamnusium bicolor]|uniref:PiggyBac transposable element-derived protein domain-containing protein n=1 Tax=Rhamnusium bicolor TaxID=1586634 RepID=A0AAV8WQA3_9CUCU|nr:hypothetical protein NQ314_019116 [Rhamnusium bicolor]
MHYTSATHPKTGKPEIISFYNMTKGGVDALNEKCTMYSSSRRTQRRCMAMFYKILDMSTVNAFVMYKCYKDAKIKLQSKDFMRDLAQSLIRPHMKRRCENHRIPVEVRGCIKRILRIERATPAKQERLEVRKYCCLCPARLHRKTSYLCCVCKKPICLTCSHKICRECAANKE